jgi:hypothetical protein
MIPVLMSRDDWVFYLEFAQLVSVCQAPFTTVADVSDRVSALFTLACAIPPMSGPSTGSPGRRATRPPPRYPGQQATAAGDHGCHAPRTSGAR